MKYARWLLLTFGCVAILAAVVITSGLVPVTASSGHWPITAWGLEFAMERSVGTNSRSITPPPLDDEGLVMRGAAHFQVGCAWCHGQPDSPPGRLVMHMTPHPSNLDEELEKWSDRELYYIVRHGVKFTGMPGWPATNREDEVWGLVAFLKRFRSMDMQQYDELVGVKEIQLARRQQQAGQDIPEVVVTKCVVCHGLDGQGRTAFPSLAGQKVEYLTSALNSYRSAARPSGTMGPLAAALTDEQVQQVASYYARLPLRKQTVELSESERASALRLIQNGEPQQRAGACNACHPLNADDSPMKITAKHSTNISTPYPTLNGQRVDYLIGQLHLFRAKVRGGGARHHIMHNMAEELSDAQIQHVAKLYAAQ